AFGRAIEAERRPRAATTAARGKARLPFAAERGIDRLRRLGRGRLRLLVARGGAGGLSLLRFGRGGGAARGRGERRQGGGGGRRAGGGAGGAIGSGGWSCSR